MFVLLAAGAVVQPVATAPEWLVPAITASATLLGAGVGGAIAFWTTRSANIRQEKAAEKRRKLEEIKDVAVRFIRLLSDQGYESMRLEQVMDSLQGRIAEVTKSSEASEEKMQDAQVDQSPPHESPETAKSDEVKSEDLVALKQRLTEVSEQRAAVNTLVVGLRQALEYMSNLARAYGEIDATAKARDALIIEMSLILPAESVRKAEKASRLQLHRDITVYLPKDLKADVKSAVDAMRDFAADIRKELGMGTLSPSPTSRDNYAEELTERIVRKAVSDQALADGVLKKMAEAKSQRSEGK